MAALGWFRWTIAAAMITVALYHLSRLVSSARHRQQGCPQVDVELTHAAMGSVMALMVVNALAPADLRGLALMFAAPAAWFATRTVHCYATAGPRRAGAPARQLLGCAAMGYMLMVLGASSSHSIVADTLHRDMSGMSMSYPTASAPNPLSSLVVRVSVVGAVVSVCGWTIARLRSHSDDAGPAFGVGCQLAVNATTIYMLVVM